MHKNWKIAHVHIFQYVPFIINSVGAYFTTGDPDGSFGP